MKKSYIATLLLILTLSTCGCTNKFAVQELNKKAQDYINNGQTEEAIARLEASIDLDNTIYETDYNLAVAYIKADKNDKAEEALNKVLELNPDFADAYYSKAVIYENKAYAVINGENNENEGGRTVIETDNNGVSVKKELSEQDKEIIRSDFEAAIDNYNQYLIKKRDASDRDKVNEKINALNSELQKYVNDPVGEN